MFVEEMGLQDVSYSGAPGPSHYPAPEGSAPSRIDAVYADPSWVKGVTGGYMVGPEEMQDRKGHCPMMVTVDVKLGEPGDDEEDEQGLDEEGVTLPPMVKWPEEADERWQQWGQRMHAGKRQRSHSHRAMRRTARVCGFTKQGGGVAGKDQAAKAGGQSQETAARGGRGKATGRGSRVANGGGTGKKEGANSEEGCGGGTREDIPESGCGA